jgi:putative tryptophan/tyrosine transport system substrate-binding protein
MTTRRALLIGLAGLAAAGRSFGQEKPRIWRVGYITPGMGQPSYHDEFPRAMRALGYEEGKNLAIFRRNAQNRFERLPGLAAELVKQRVDIIVVSSTPGMTAAKQATATIPIVMALVGDPVKSGFVASLAQPGGNITGLSLATTDTSTKWLELARSIAPKARVALLVNPNQQTAPWHIENIEKAASKLGSSVFPVYAPSPADFERAFETMAQERAGVVIVVPSGLFDATGKTLAQLGVKYRMAMIASTRNNAEDGALISYGQDYGAFVRRAATYVDKIFKGAKPRELPVEQPTIMELVINRATAAKLGLALPQELMLRADQVIE